MKKATMGWVRIPPETSLLLFSSSSHSPLLFVLFLKIGEVPKQSWKRFHEGVPASPAICPPAWRGPRFREWKTVLSDVLSMCFTCRDNINPHGRNPGSSKHIQLSEEAEDIQGPWEVHLYEEKNPHFPAVSNWKPGGSHCSWGRSWIRSQRVTLRDQRGPTHNAGLFSRETIKHLKTTTADKVEWSHCHPIFAGVMWQKTDWLRKVEIRY